MIQLFPLIPASQAGGLIHQQRCSHLQGTVLGLSRIPRHHLGEMGQASAMSGRVLTVTHSSNTAWEIMDQTVSFSFWICSTETTPVKAVNRGLMAHTTDLAEQ